MTKPIATLCGFYSHYAKHMDVADRKILSMVKRPILNQIKKGSYLRQYCKIRVINISNATTIVEGARYTYIPQAAGTGFSFRGKKLLWTLVAIKHTHKDPSGPLYLQGNQTSKRAG